MDKYNYYIEIQNDVEYWLDQNDFDLSHFENKEEAAEFLYDELWAEDDITGNGNSYYDNEYNCETYLSHNLEKAMIACEEFGVETKTILTHLHSNDLARYLDCTIRCYLLKKVIYNVLDKIWKE